MLRNQEGDLGGGGIPLPTPPPMPVPPTPGVPLPPLAPEADPGDEGDITNEGGLGDLPPLPPPPPPEPPPGPSNTPLAIEGSFARPGTAEARPFGTSAFERDRLVAEGQPRELRFGAGASNVGGPAGAMDEDLVAAIMAARGRKR